MIARTTLSGICLLSLLPLGQVGGQDSLKRQIKSTDPVTELPAAELGELGDPFFELVLKDHPGTFRLPQVEQLLQPRRSQRVLFVVGEKIASPSATNVHRAVIAFTGANAGVALSPNVMLSAVFNGNDFPEDPEAAAPQTPLPFLEAWGWDGKRGRYNYYRLDRAGGGLSWKFRGSSEGAAALTAAQRSGTCFECHLNGAPIMKELLKPWNHWHSGDFRIRPLGRLQPADVRWEVATEPRFVGDSGDGGLAAAVDLDRMIRGSIKEFNQHRINKHQVPLAGGAGINIVRANELLRPLFETTEFNIISSKEQSNLHPLSGTPMTQPALAFEIPPSFFINSDLIGGGGLSGFKGLGIAEAIRFPGIGAASVQPAEYKQLVNDAELRVDGQPGDAVFAWLTPEPGNIDNQICDELVLRGVVPGQYLAAVLAIDLRTPLLSENRRTLRSFVPAEFEVAAAPPANPHDLTFFEEHRLTRATIAALEAASPAAGSVEMDFLKLLRMEGGSPRDQLKKRVEEYATELNSKLGDPLTRGGELKRLFEQLINARQSILDDPVLGRLDETGGELLFPAHPTR